MQGLHSPSGIWHLLVPISLQREVSRLPTVLSKEGRKMERSLYIRMIHSRFFLLDSDQLG